MQLAIWHYLPWRGDRWCYELCLAGPSRMNICTDPTSQIDPIRTPVREPRPFSEKQVEAILRIIPHDEKRNQLLFTLLSETGMRVSEALSLHVPDICMDDMDGA